MKRRLTRRSLLAAAPGAAACLVAAPRPVRAEALSMDALLAINDDDNAVIDVLTAYMWNSPGLVAQANLSNILDWGHHVNSVPPQRTYGVDFAPPGFVIPYNVDRNFDTYNSQMALLFACIDAAEARQDVSDFVNIANATTALKNNARVPLAQEISDVAYRELLLLSRPKDHPGAPLLTEYSGDWGGRLVETLQDKYFINQVLSRKDQSLARRNLSLQRYKLRRLLNPDIWPMLWPIVARKWRSYDLAQTVFPLAANDPWPPNYYDVMVQTSQTPLKPLVNALLATHTTGSHKECVPVPGMFGGEESCANVDDDSYGANFVDFLRQQVGTLGVAR
jgi:hypothetical protein